MMGERNSSLFGRLTLKPKRQLATSSSSSSSRSAPSPLTTPETETPTTSFSGPSDYGLGYSSINHERSPTYSGKRISHVALPRPIEFDRYAQSSSTLKRSTSSRSRPTNRLGVVHDEEEPLFVEIVHEAAPTRAIQSTFRARTSFGASPPYTAHAAAAEAIDVPRPQSPFAMTGTASHSLVSRPSQRMTVRRCYSANDSEVVRASPSSAKALAEISAASDHSFYAVARGWKKGVYTTKEDAERQIRNFPGPLLQVFRDRAAADNFIANAGRFTQKSAHQDESDDELVERTRIFTGLDPNSELGRRRSQSLSAERKEAQRRSRMHIAMHSPQTAAVNSPPLSLRSVFSDIAPVSPIDEINGFGSFPTPVPLQSMSLLPVQHLASSIAFYAKVLGFTCVSQVPSVQAVMSSSSATICLRTVDQAPPPPSGANVTRLSMIRTSSNGKPDPLSHGRLPLPTMSEEHLHEAEVSLPPTPESLNLCCTEPEPLDLPSTSLPLRVPLSTLSGTTVLIEYNGALEAMHSLLSARLNEWRLERNKGAQTSVGAKVPQCPADTARILGGVQQTPWDAQELHLCDLDGHRLIYTTPFLRGTPGASLI